MKYIYEEKEIELYDKWEQVSFNNYLRITRIVENNQKVPYDEEILAICLLECFSNVADGYLNDISWGQLTDLIPHVNDLMLSYNNLNLEEVTLPKSWILDDIEYSYYLSPNEYKAGEVSDIKTYIKRQENRVDYLADIAAVMIRPATKVTSDAGVTSFKLTKNNPADHEINKKRVLHLPFLQVNRILTFFLYGLMTSMSGTKNSIQESQKI